MNYQKCTDEQLVGLSKQGDMLAVSALFERYRELLEKMSKKLFLVGGDQDDLMQEGRLGLFIAVNDYDQEKNDHFYPFAKLCISRQQIKAIEQSNRKKHQPLNCYVSIYDEQGGSTTDTLLSKTEKSPEELFLDDEAYGDLRKSLFLELSALEKKVMLLKMQAYDYHEIAKVLDKSPKAIDNAIQRIRAKAKKVMTDKRNET